MSDNVREDGSIDTDFGDYCIHGKYIGTPGGWDILCGYCEEGISREEYKEIVRYAMLRKMQEALKVEWFNVAFDMMRTFFPVWAGNVDRHPLHTVMDEALAEIKALSYDEANQLCVTALGWVDLRD